MAFLSHPKHSVKGTQLGFSLPSELKEAKQTKLFCKFGQMLVEPILFSLNGLLGQFSLWIEL